MDTHLDSLEAHLNALREIAHAVDTHLDSLEAHLNALPSAPLLPFDATGRIYRFEAHAVDTHLKRMLWTLTWIRWKPTSTPCRV